MLCTLAKPKLQCVQHHLPGTTAHLLWPASHVSCKPLITAPIFRLLFQKRVLAFVCFAMQPLHDSLTGALAAALGDQSRLNGRPKVVLGVGKPD